MHFARERLRHAALAVPVVDALLEAIGDASRAIRICSVKARHELTEGEQHVVLYALRTCAICLAQGAHLDRQRCWHVEGSSCAGRSLGGGGMGRGGIALVSHGRRAVCHIACQRLQRAMRFGDAQALAAARMAQARPSCREHELLDLMRHAEWPPSIAVGDSLGADVPEVGLTLLLIVVDELEGRA